MLGGCDRLSESPKFQELLDSAEGSDLSRAALLGGRKSMAREFAAADLSPDFKVNGTHAPDTPEYAPCRKKTSPIGACASMASSSGRSICRWPICAPCRSATQITRHDCVEGWSAIGKWQGAPLAEILKSVGIAAFCAVRGVSLRRFLRTRRPMEPGQYYESIDLIDAFHPQTILAHSLNDEALSVGHGAPLRLRVERQLGYKQAKYVMRIEMTDRLDQLGRGKGGFWPDRGYEWYAGI